HLDWERISKPTPASSQLTEYSTRMCARRKLTSTSKMRTALNTAIRFSRCSMVSVTSLILVCCLARNSGRRLFRRSCGSTLLVGCGCGLLACDFAPEILLRCIHISGEFGGIDKRIGAARPHASAFLAEVEELPMGSKEYVARQL